MIREEGNGQGERTGRGQEGRKVFPLAGSVRRVTQVRGVLADQVAVSIPLDPYLSLRALADYSGLSIRRLRDLLDDPGRPLPCYRIGGKILVRRSEYDTWASTYRRVGRGEVARVVADILKGL